MRMRDVCGKQAPYRTSRTIIPLRRHRRRWRTSRHQRPLASSHRSASCAAAPPSPWRAAALVLVLALAASTPALLLVLHLTSSVETLAHTSARGAVARRRLRGRRDEEEEFVQRDYGDDDIAGRAHMWSEDLDAGSHPLVPHHPLTDGGDYEYEYSSSSSSSGDGFGDDDDFDPGEDGDAYETPEDIQEHIQEIAQKVKDLAAADDEGRLAGQKAASIENLKDIKEAEEEELEEEEEIKRSIPGVVKEYLKLLVMVSLALPLLQLLQLLVFAVIRYASGRGGGSRRSPRDDSDGYDHVLTTDDSDGYDDVQLVGLD